MFADPRMMLRQGVTRIIGTSRCMIITFKFKHATGGRITIGAPPDASVEVVEKLIEREKNR